MLHKWTEFLPVFIVRWLALRYCERFTYSYEGRVPRTFAVARPGLMFKVDQDIPDVNTAEKE